MTRVAEWSAAVGDTWAREWRRTDRSFAGLELHLERAILAAAPPATARAIDIGCGAGTTSLAIAAARPGWSITAIDVSAELIAVAEERGSGHANLAFRQGDVQALPPALAGADLLFSRHGVMFFDDPAAAFGRLHAAAARDAALVFSCFRARELNPWALELVAAVSEAASPVPATSYTPGPFAFADPAFVEPLLAAAGWCDIALVGVDYSYRAGEGDDPVADALDFFTRVGPAAPLLRAAPPERQHALRGRMVEVLARYRWGDAVDMPASAWVWSAKARSGERA